MTSTAKMVSGVAASGVAGIAKVVPGVARAGAGWLLLGVSTYYCFMAL